MILKRIRQNQHRVKPNITIKTLLFCIAYYSYVFGRFIIAPLCAIVKGNLKNYLQPNLSVVKYM